MADGGRPCPHCASAETAWFADGSGACRSCGRAIRGATPVGAMIMGEEVETRKKAKVRERSRLGLLGVVGGVLGYVGIPGIVLIGGALSGRGASDYVARVINEPAGAIACGGITLLVIAATFALWAGWNVWHGLPEKSFHLLLAGALTALGGAMAGLGAPGAIGIVGGILALVAGLLAWRKSKAPEEPPETDAPSSTA